MSSLKICMYEVIGIYVIGVVNFNTFKKKVKMCLFCGLDLKGLHMTSDR